MRANALARQWIQTNAAFTHHGGRVNRIIIERSQNNLIFGSPFSLRDTVLFVVDLPMSPLAVLRLQSSCHKSFQQETNPSCFSLPRDTVRTSRLEKWVLLCSRTFPEHNARHRKLSNQSIKCYESRRKCLENSP